MEVLISLLLLVLSWLPVQDPGVTYYRLFAQAHYKVVESCPTPDNPFLECVWYLAGERLEATVPASDCGGICLLDASLPALGSGDWLAWQLVASRGSGCESETAWPPT